MVKKKVAKKITHHALVVDEPTSRSTDKIMKEVDKHISKAMKDMQVSIDIAIPKSAMMSRFKRRKKEVAHGRRI